MKRLICAAAIVGTTLITSGCTTYYQVREPTGGRAYYTTDLEDTRAGAVKFKDGKSGATITLQNSEIHGGKIRKVRAQEGDMIAPADARRDQCVGDLIGPAVQFAEGEALLAAHHRLGLRPATRVLLDHRRQIEHVIVISISETRERKDVVV